MGRSVWGEVYWSQQTRDGTVRHHLTITGTLYGEADIVVPAPAPGSSTSEAPYFIHLMRYPTSVDLSAIAGVVARLREALENEVERALRHLSGETLLPTQLRLTFPVDQR